MWKTRSFRLDKGQTVSGILSAARRCIRAASGMACTPWSMRSTWRHPARSRCRAGGASSSACATSRKPNCGRGRRPGKSGVRPTSLDAKPMPTILSRSGSACSRHSKASSSLKWRRKHVNQRGSGHSGTWLAHPAQALGTAADHCLGACAPWPVWVWVSKKISVCNTLSACALARYAQVMS